MIKMEKSEKKKAVVYIILAILIGSTIAYLDLSKDRTNHLIPADLYPERKIEKTRSRLIFLNMGLFYQENDMICL